jgi:hypothetical protein
VLNNFQRGWAAINLEMSDKVPRTEYSTGYHKSLISKVTGISLEELDDPEVFSNANKEFMKQWEFTFMWNTLIGGGIFGDKKTFMGHAEYAEKGADKDTRTGSYFEDVEDIYLIDFDALYGIPNKKEWKDRFERHYKDSVNYYPDAVNMTGIYVTCISGLIDLFGWDLLLLGAGYDPLKFGQLTNRYNDWISRYFEALAKADVPVVMIHDDMVWTSGAFISPEWYRKFVFPHYKKIFTLLKESGKKIMFTSDGNYSEFIDDLVKAGVDGFVLEPMTDMKYIADKYGKTHSFIGNADTRILLYGSKDDIYKEVKRCMDIGKKYPGFFMAVGNHIPANTPVDSCLYYNEYYEQLSLR